MENLFTGNATSRSGISLLKIHLALLLGSNRNIQFQLPATTHTNCVCVCERERNFYETSFFRTQRKIKIAISGKNRNIEILFGLIAISRNLQERETIHESQRQLILFTMKTLNPE